MTVIAVNRTEIDRMSVLHDLADGRIKQDFCDAVCKRTGSPQTCARADQLEPEMKHHPRFDIASEAASREAAKIRAMIVDIVRIIGILDCDIATEEEGARVSNRSDAAYPILARMLAARRDNLKATVAALERRLVEMGALLLEEFNNT